MPRHWLIRPDISSSTVYRSENNYFTLLRVLTPCLTLRDGFTFLHHQTAWLPHNLTSDLTAWPCAMTILRRWKQHVVTTGVCVCVCVYGGGKLTVCDHSLSGGCRRLKKAWRIKFLQDVRAHVSGSNCKCRKYLFSFYICLCLVVPKEFKIWGNVETSVYGHCPFSCHSDHTRPLCFDHPLIRWNVLSSSSYTRFDLVIR